MSIDLDFLKKSIKVWLRFIRISFSSYGIFYRHETIKEKKSLMYTLVEIIPTSVSTLVYGKPYSRLTICGFLINVGASHAYPGTIICFDKSVLLVVVLSALFFSIFLEKNSSYSMSIESELQI